MTEQTTATELPAFSLQDLENAVKVIDAACTRGAFRGEEMSSVGAVRDKLVAFLVASTPKAPEGEEAEEAEEAPAPAKAVKKPRAKS